MPHSSFGSISGQDISVSNSEQDGGTLFNLSQVLVVGRSPINCVVVSKIVERSGLKPVSESPEKAGRMLMKLHPGTVILDGGSDNHDCDDLFASITNQRRSSGRNLPLVILLSTRTGTPGSLSLHSSIDAVVAKPITTESLQPVIDRLVGRARS